MDQGLGSPVSSADNIARAAERLYAANNSSVACAPIRDLISEGDLAGAYAVQKANVQHWKTSGRRVVGRKVGLTAAAVQKALGIDQPDFGTLFVDMEISDGATVPTGRLLQPRVEGEIAFVLGSDLALEDPSIADVIRAVDFALPAIEIVDSRIMDWDISIVDTIADNGSSGLYVLGAGPVQIDRIDLKMCGMVLEKNGEVASTGAGLACLGHPLHAVRWLAKTLACSGQPLSAGDIVLSGALGPMVAVKAGDDVEVRISGVGSVSVRFGQ